MLPIRFRGLFEYRAVLENGVTELDFNLNEARETDYIAAIWKGRILDLVRSWSFMTHAAG